MTVSGQSNIKGINSQAWAAMSLFLQHLRFSNFLRIELEAPKLADFNLVFHDGHKIICESKDYKTAISFANVRKIISEIERDRQIGLDDEILIICSKLSDRTKNEIENYKYWGEAKDPFFMDKGFTKSQIALLPKVRFWEVPATENQTIVYSLFAEILGTWVPEYRLEEKVSSLMIQKIYEKSAKGDKYSRADILSDINEYKKNLILESGHFDNEKIKVEQQLRNIIDAIHNDKAPIWAKNQLSALSAQPSKMFFLLDVFQEKTDLTLSKWNDLWEAFAVSIYPSHLFEIFKKNLANHENRTYVLGFVKKSLPRLASFYNARFFEVDSIEISHQILELDQTLTKQILEISQQILRGDRKDIFYVKNHQDRNWEREKNAELLKDLYCNGNQEIKAGVIKVVDEAFNLVNDDGKYWLDTPNQIFELLKNYAEEDPNELIPELSKIFIDQYKKNDKRYNVKFKGWEHIGSGVSHFGNEYEITDRHFVAFVLAPVIDDFYIKDRKTAWLFILNKCVTRSAKKVNVNKPDFLNRAAIPVLIDEYVSGPDHETAYAILLDFIRMRKGIPSKTEIIFQFVRDSSMSDMKKWKLVKACLDEFKGLPINPFVEQITLDLANKGLDDALVAIAKWYGNTEYLKYQRFHGTSVADHVTKLFKHRKTFSAGIEILEAYISGKYFREKEDSFDIYEVARCLTQIIEKDVSKGLAILDSVYRTRGISPNQQNLLCSSIKEINKASVLRRVFKDFLNPILCELSTSKKIENKFNDSNARQSIVQFAEKLAKNAMYNEALSILQTFLSDSNPHIENEEDDPTGQFNYHRKILNGEETFLITGVRSYIPWVLQQFCIPKGRNYIPKVMTILEKLYRDENVYVRSQVCVPLIELARRRSLVIRGTKKRFMSKRLARKVEDMAYQMLDDAYKITASGEKPIMLFKSLDNVLLNMRDVDATKASQVLEVFQIKGMEEAATGYVPLLIYYSEFRMRHDKSFKPDRFQEIAQEIMRTGAPQIRHQFSWHFWKISADTLENEKKTGLTYDLAFKICNSNLQILAERYDKSVFQDIYRFIEDNLERKYDECVTLWMRCLNKEREFIVDNLEVLQADEIRWWPYYYNGKILKKIYDEGEEERFFEALEFLVDYPKEASTGDISPAVEILKNLPRSDKQVETIMDKLIERNPLYFKAKQEWLGKTGGQSSKDGCR